MSYNLLVSDLIFYFKTPYILQKKRRAWGRGGEGRKGGGREDRRETPKSFKISHFIRVWSRLPPPPLPTLPPNNTHLTDHNPLPPLSICLFAPTQPKGLLPPPPFHPVLSDAHPPNFGF